MNRWRHILLAFAIIASRALGQSVELRPVEPVTMPVAVDSNTASFWKDGQFHMFSSTGTPVLSSGPSATQLSPGVPFDLGGIPEPAWIESAWMSPEGVLFVWYHHEQMGLCGDVKLNVPQIGAALSYDGGRTMVNLGIVLDATENRNCAAQNGYFAGGHGDFSVTYNDRDGYFYFYFGSYSGEVSEQGVSMARMPYEARYSPAGSVEKWFNGGWSEPGLGGRVTPVFPAKVSWYEAGTDSFWGPSVHWNTHLRQYVMLLNHACCDPGWPQEGIYISYNPDPANPAGWSEPRKILEGGAWYPAAIGTGEGETDSMAGKTARLWVRGFSDWELVFSTPEEMQAAEPKPPTEPALPAEPAPPTEPKPPVEPAPPTEPAPPADPAPPAEPAPPVDPTPPAVVEPGPGIPEPGPAPDEPAPEAENPPPPVPADPA
ncbi:MAG: hypothetical protein IT163_05215 [Bryobacterales bacterium]|nr:hypothetical protein [Bryobacterales bacterium]